MSILSNDKTTAKDEIIITVFITIALIIGVTLIILGKKSIIPTTFITFGVLMVLVFIILLPCVIYRFTENYKDDKHSDK